MATMIRAARENGVIPILIARARCSVIYDAAAVKELMEAK